MVLKPQDILVLLKLLAMRRKNFIYSQVAERLFMSPSEVHAAIKRCTAVRLFDSNSMSPNKKALEEFLVHGIKYCFPPDRGEITRGVPTIFAAPPLRDHFIQQEDLPPVWPHPEGDVKGYSFSPLYRTVPNAVMQDNILYMYLVLVDALRDGRAREKDIAAKELKKMLYGGE